MKSFTRSCLVATTLFALGASALGCSGAQRGSGGSFRGTVTVRNESGLRVCQVMPESLGQGERIFDRTNHAASTLSK